MHQSHFNPREIMAAAPDAMRLAMGLNPKNPHPLAMGLTLKEMAYAAGAVVRPGLVGSPNGQVMAMGLGMGDFSKALAQATHSVIVNTFTAQDEHSKFCTRVEAKNFQPLPVARLDADVALEPLAEGAEISRTASIVTAGATSAQLLTFAKILQLSREAIFNDELELFARVAAGLGASAARLESLLVAQALESNPVLDDGLPVFDAVGNVYKNIVTGAISAASLGEAMASLRMQTTASGSRAELAARHLVTSPHLEITARGIVTDLGLDIQVSVLSHLPAGRWCLLGNPAVNPVVGLLKLQGSTDPVQVTPQMKRPIECDGSAIKVVADLGAFLMSRTGIVRGGV